MPDGRWGIVRQPTEARTLRFGVSGSRAGVGDRDGDGERWIGEVPRRGPQDPGRRIRSRGSAPVEVIQHVHSNRLPDGRTAEGWVHRWGCRRSRAAPLDQMAREFGQHLRFVGWLRGRGDRRRDRKDLQLGAFSLRKEDRIAIETSFPPNEADSGCFSGRLLVGCRPSRWSLISSCRRSRRECGSRLGECGTSPRR